MPLLVAIPLLAGGGGGLAAALTSAATKAAIALGLIAFIGKHTRARWMNGRVRCAHEDARSSHMYVAVGAVDADDD